MAEKEPTGSGDRRPIPRWAWVLVAIVLVAGLVAGVSVFYAKSHKDEATAPAASSAAPAASGADGCIAGRDNDAKSLIEGAKKQAHTDEGAAATAAGLMRFMFQYPWPSQKQLEQMMGELSTVDSSEISATAKSLRQTPGPREARTAGYSIADGRYRIGPETTADSVVVSIDAAAITDGQLNGESLVRTFTMEWDGDIWKLDGSADTGANDSNLDDATTFVGGC